MPEIVKSNNKEQILIALYVAQTALRLKQDREIRNLSELSTTDPVTGLLNLRGLLGDPDADPPIIAKFQQNFELAKRYGHPLSVLMVDFDNLKRYNDTYGHLRGTKAIERIAHVAQSMMRHTDIGARYGGDEDVFVLPETDINGAARFSYRLQSALRRATRETPVTISVGIASLLDDNPKTHLELLDYADKAVYFAKHKGRNTISTYRGIPHNNK